MNKYNDLRGQANLKYKRMLDEKKHSFSYIQGWYYQELARISALELAEKTEEARREHERHLKIIREGSQSIRRYGGSVR
jgi:hypothetical protein